MAKAGRPRKDKNITTTKSETKVESKSEVKLEKIEINNTQPTSTTPIKRKQIVDIDRNALIPCKSIVYGKLTYVSPRTQLIYNWSDYGTEEFIEYGELITMRSASPKFLTKPWILIQDDEVVEYFRLQDIYEKLLLLDNINEFLLKPFSEIETLFESAPMGIKQTFTIKIGEMVHAKTINDIRVVNMIDKTMGTNLKEFI